METSRKFWVMDYETLVDCFIAVFRNIRDDTDTKIFVVSKLGDDFEEYIQFLSDNIETKDWHLGFNNIAFDAQITEYILDNIDYLTPYPAEQRANFIYQYAQSVINRTDRNEFLDYPEWKFRIPCMDVFRINHWDNVAKSCSLKWAQYAMDWENVEEMPYHHTKSVDSFETLDEIILYCINDVESTEKVFMLCLDAIKLRIEIHKQYGIPCFSYPNTKIGTELLLKLYSDKTGQDKRVIRKLRTYRTSVAFSDVIFPYISFETPEFQQLLNEFKHFVTSQSKGGFTKEFDFRGYVFSYGQGGLHQCIESGVYKEDDDYIIIDADINSMYPSIAIANKMYPAHLGELFYQVYKEDIVDIRLTEKAKKEKGNKTIVEGYKEAANSCFGKSNEKTSWLYDPMYFMRTTVNGQLLISMLIEKILISIRGATLLQSNTDGITVRILRKDYEQYKQICSDWEQQTKLGLEFAEYSKMVIRDVNNYISIYTNGKTKCKGAFEWEPFEQYKPSHIHKNKSFLIIPKALYQYFVHGVSPKTTVESCKNIYDFCAGVKSKGDWRFWEIGVENCEYFERPLKKIVRYYISNRGSKIVKRNIHDNREIQTESGSVYQTIFNKYIQKDWEDYNINYKYYINKIQDEIDNIENKISATINQQLTLF
jgi:hypothetical protein